MRSRRPEPQPHNPSPMVPIGTYKQVGETGPAYQVGEPLRQLPDDDWKIRITLVTTGEVTEYRLSSMLNDPDAR